MIETIKKDLQILWDNKFIKWIYMTKSYHFISVTIEYINIIIKRVTLILRINTSVKKADFLVPSMIYSSKLHCA